MPSNRLTSRVGAVAPRARLLGRLRDGGTLPTSWNGCDGTWCYGHVSINYQPSGQAWNMNFAFDVKFSQNCSNAAGQTIWGSNWYVGGSTGMWQSWNSFRYTNTANSSHNEEWPNAYGNISFNPPLIGTPWTDAAHIGADMNCSGSHWTWSGDYHSV